MDNDTFGSGHPPLLQFTSIVPGEEAFRLIVGGQLLQSSHKWMSPSTVVQFFTIRYGATAYSYENKKGTVIIHYYVLQFMFTSYTI